MLLEWSSGSTSWVLPQTYICAHLGPAPKYVCLSPCLPARGRPGAKLQQGQRLPKCVATLTLFPCWPILCDFPCYSSPASSLPGGCGSATARDWLCCAALAVVGGGGAFLATLKSSSMYVVRVIIHPILAARQLPWLVIPCSCRPDAFTTSVCVRCLM